MSRVDGVRYYRHGYCGVTIAFPNGDVKCRNCRGHFKQYGRDGLFDCMFSAYHLDIPDNMLDTRHPECPLELEPLPEGEEEKR